MCDKSTLTGYIRRQRTLAGYILFYEGNGTIRPHFYCSKSGRTENVEKADVFKKIGDAMKVSAKVSAEPIRYKVYPWYD